MSVAEQDALEARFGLKVCGRLNAGLDLSHEVNERLRVARESAVARAMSTKTVARLRHSSGTMVQANGSAAFHFGAEHTSWWVRLSSVAPLLVLVLGLLLIHDWSKREQIAAAADIDAALLGDALPPEAYTDPGFDEFLLAPDQPASL